MLSRQLPSCQIEYIQILITHLHGIMMTQNHSDLNIWVSIIVRIYLNFQCKTMLIFTSLSIALIFGWIFELYLDHFTNLVFVGQQFYEHSLVL